MKRTIALLSAMALVGLLFLTGCTERKSEGAPAAQSSEQAQSFEAPQAQAAAPQDNGMTSMLIAGAVGYILGSSGNNAVNTVAAQPKTIQKTIVVKEATTVKPPTPKVSQGFGTHSKTPVAPSVSSASAAKPVITYREPTATRSVIGSSAYRSPSTSSYRSYSGYSSSRSFSSSGFRR
jgi:hypothetical protein